MHPIEAIVRNPVKVWVGVFLISLFGAVAWLNMPMQLTPEVQIPTISIETRWPGASPQEVEREIIQEQEEQLKGVEGITKMSSESADSLGRITLEFAVGTNMDEVLLRVNSRLQQVREYPQDADEPVISTSSSSDSPIAWFILGQSLPPAERIAAFIGKHPQFKADLDQGARIQQSGHRPLPSEGIGPAKAGAAHAAVPRGDDRIAPPIGGVFRPQPSRSFAARR